MGEALTLAVLLTLKDEASEAVKKFKDNITPTQTALLGMGAAAAAGGALAIKTLIDCGNAAAEEERGILKLKAAVEASGESWDDASAKIEDYLAAELRRTALDDGAGRESIATLTTITGDYRQALELMPLAQDLAAAKGMDLASAAQLVGRVAEGNTGILTRYGIVLQDGATSQEALAAMQATFAGQAEAYGNSTAGAQERMNIAMGNLKETVGSYVLPIMADFANTLADLASRAIPWVQNVIEGAISFWEENKVTIIAGLAALAVVILIQVIPAFIAWAGAAAASAMSTMAALAPVVLPVLAIMGAVALLKEAWENDWGGMRTFLTDVWENKLKPIFETLKTWFTETLPDAARQVYEFIRDRWEDIRTAVSGVWDWLKGTFETIKTWFTVTLPNAARDLFIAIRDRWTDIQDKIDAVWRSVKETLEAIKTWFTETLPNAARDMKEAISTKVGELGTALSTAWDNIKETAKTKWDSIVGGIKDAFSVDWGALGRGILDGIWNGIQSGWDWITGKVRDLANNLLDAAKRALGIGSPSRLFALQVGLPIAEGVMQGMEQGLRTAGGFWDALVPAGAVGGMAPSVAGGGAVHYHLNYYATQTRPGAEDADAAMRRLEWLVRVRGI
jgi:hypothetical protein